MAVSDSGTIQLGGEDVHRLGCGAMRIVGDGVWGPCEDHGEVVSGTGQRSSALHGA